MDLEDIVHNAMQAERAEEMKESEQLTLGELILKVDAVEDKAKGIFFDDTNIRPTGVGSWRGSYRELAIRYDSDSDGMTAAEFLDTLRDANGRTFKGYKGGDFKMGKTTPVWVANYGESQGFEHRNHGIVDVTETDDKVVIQTAETPY